MDQARSTCTRAQERHQQQVLQLPQYRTDEVVAESSQVDPRASIALSKAFNFFLFLCVSSLDEWYLTVQSASFSRSCSPGRLETGVWVPLSTHTQCRQRVDPLFCTTAMFKSNTCSPPPQPPPPLSPHGGLSF